MSNYRRHAANLYMKGFYQGFFTRPVECSYTHNRQLCVISKNIENFSTELNSQEINLRHHAGMEITVGDRQLRAKFR